MNKSSIVLFSFLCFICNISVNIFIFRDLRANLELAIECVIELASSPENTLDSDYTSDSEDAPVVLCNVKLTGAVRKQLALSIRDLMQHGLMPVSAGIVLKSVLKCTPVILTVSVTSHSM